MVLEKTLESPLDCKEIQPVHPKGNQSWVFVGRTDVEAEAPILWPPDSKNWLTWKDHDAWKDWRQEEKEKTDDEMVEWHQQLNGCEFEQALEVGEGRGKLVCYSPWGLKESDMTYWLNWTELRLFWSILRFEKPLLPVPMYRNNFTAFHCTVQWHEEHHTFAHLLYPSLEVSPS